ncbi:hypothetical protein AB0399_33480 [Streptomyces sp. NPDC088194]|uniref:hypothetical protein n=1 Tax=Streptomyces sp. NPDC088194 TaxID=3154931 RepID=UPI00344FDD4F
MRPPHDPQGPNGPTGTHGPEGPDDAPEMDEQTPRAPHDPHEPHEPPQDETRDEASAQQEPPTPAEPASPGAADADDSGSAASGSADADADAAGVADDSGSADAGSTDAGSTNAGADEPTAPVRAVSGHADPVGEPIMHDVTPLSGATDLDDLTSDEASLRALMHQAVDGLHASPDALEHLRRAVPLRRQRRRQAVLGAVAAVILVGLAVPAVVRVAGRSGHTTAAQVGVGSSYTVTPDAGGHRKGDAADPSGKATHRPDKDRPPAGTPTGPRSTPSGSGAPAPDCSSAQLGQGLSEADTPDADGRVYGWFRVANVSGTPCTVPSGGVIRAVAHGSAEQAAIQVVGHTQGDPATGLPAVMAETPIVLGPGQDYEVAFAWVPTSGTTGCVATTTPPTSSTPTPSSTGSDGSDQGTDSGSDSSSGNVQPAGGVPPTSAPASVTLDHTPAAGAPVVAGPVIQGACAGTVYTTPPIAEALATTP